ncbi:MAG: hypothetical protein L0226_04540, partial [Acidobacteria bacterium]|nr:hypothetical protein [Acidobacteriota bacterium]
PAEIEVTTEGLKVHSVPGNDAPVIGVVLQGSKHKVLEGDEWQWMQIEVSRWDETQYHVTNQNRGWVYGKPGLVRVVSRRWW